jgi:hypothetical protein
LVVCGHLWRTSWNLGGLLALIDVLTAWVTPKRSPEIGRDVSRPLVGDQLVHDPKACKGILSVKERSRIGRPQI